MPRTPSKKTLTKKLDTAWSKAVKNLAKNKCEVCGKVESLNSHHVVGRRNRRLRWELFNGVCLCAGCHTFKLESAHQNPEWFHFWMEENRWEDLRDVNCKMFEIKKWTIPEMQEKLKELEAVYE